MDNIRPRTSSFSPSTRFSTTRTPHRPQRPKKIMKSIWVKKASTVGSQAVLPQNVNVKGSAMINPTQTWRPKGAYLDSVNRDDGSYTLKQFEYGNPEEDLKDYAIIDSGCSGSMTGDKDKLSDFKEFKGGYVAFGNDPKGGRITGKGTIKTSCIDFEKVSYVEELKFNLLSVSQICDKKHNVLFTDKECLILSPKFKFVDEDLVILRAPRKNDVYSLDLKNIIPSGGVTCLVAKATKDEAVLWHRRLGHVNFKNINKLVKGNLVRGLPSKTFKLDHSCLACRKGKQHRASCKKIEERTVREPLELLHMDLFGPVSVESVNRKKELGVKGEPLIVEVEEQMVAPVMDMEEDLAMMFGVEGDSSDDDFEGPEGDEEVWEMDEEWLMAPVTPPLMPVMPLPSTYEVGGSSTAADVGHSLTLLAPKVYVPSSVIKDLCTRMGNLEYGHGLLVKKVITVSDAEVADSIDIGEIGPRVSIVEGQMQVMASQMVQVVSGLEQVEAHVEQGSGSRKLEIIMIGYTGIGTKDYNSWGNFGCMGITPLLLLWSWKIMVILDYEFYVIVDVVALE
ncbi:putative ribonuclease H-like domain-containing protein [Tanacetum coccineum]